MKKQALVIVGGLLLSASAAMAAGGGALKEVDLVKVQYLNYAEIMNGEPVYHQGETVMFRVSLYNFSDRSYKKVPVQTTLHWTQTALCNGWVFEAGAPLPESSRSDLQFITMEKQDVGYFDVSYRIPDVCPNEAEIHLEVGRGNIEPLILREKFLVQ